MIGAGSSVGSGVGVTVAIGQVLADIPEGAATVLTLRGNQVPRRRRMLASASLVLRRSSVPSSPISPCEAVQRRGSWLRWSARQGSSLWLRSKT